MRLTKAAWTHLISMPRIKSIEAVIAVRLPDTLVDGTIANQPNILQWNAGESCSVIFGFSSADAKRYWDAATATSTVASRPNV